MFSPIIAFVASFIDQIGSVLIKKTENSSVNPATVWESGFLSILSGSLIIFVYVTINGQQQHLDISKIWLFVPRLTLEIVQVYVTFTALKIADLSSYNFIRVFSIVFVVFSEIILIGTILTFVQYIAIFTIFISIAYIFRHGVKKVAGWKFLALSAVNGGLLNVLAKYQFMYNDPYLNEAVVRLGIIIILTVILRKQLGKYYIAHIKEMLRSNKSFVLLLPSRALVGILNILALNLGPVAIYSTAERAGSVLSGVALGHAVFKEKSINEKIAVSLAIIAGVSLLILG